MKKLSVSWTIKKIVQNIDRGNVLFNHLMQRKSGQWNDEQKSLLIHSLISDYPVPAIYSVQDDDSNKYSILDGKQRLTNVSDFMKNEWRITKDTPNVIINNIEYEIANKLFKELDEEVQEELEDASLLMYIFEDCTEDEIEEIFYRLNNGTALTKDQKTRAKLGNELVSFIDDTLNLEFFKTKTYFTKYQLKKAEDQTCILQTLILLSNYDFKMLGNDDVLKFVKEYRYNYNNDDLIKCKNLFEQLNNMIPEQNKLMKKIHIPMFAITLQKALNENIDINIFAEWINNFIKNYNSKTEYASYCKGNTTNKIKVNKRLKIMYDDMINYCHGKEI